MSNDEKGGYAGRGDDLWSDVIFHITPRQASWSYLISLSRLLEPDLDPIIRERMQRKMERAVERNPGLPNDSVYLRGLENFNVDDIY